MSKTPKAIHKVSKIRKEVHLTHKVIDKLQEKADEEGRSLKNYMEWVLIEDSKK